VYTEKRYLPDYSRIYQKHWNKKICEVAMVSEGDNVLDYGCGTGILFPELLGQGCRVVGLDLSFEMLHSCESTTGNVLRVCADGCNSPFADNSFDSIVCRGSIHHLPDLEKGFREIFRLLKKDGFFVFSEPSNDSIINRLARRIMYRKSEEFHEEDEGFFRKEIIPMLEKIGFQIEESRGFGFAAYTLAGFPDKINILGKVPGNCQITKLLILIDRFFESLPLINRLALHWQVRARKHPLQDRP
jgi:ubiquinone/menaquinone biosynthesis C-methylase UbiE